MAAKSPGVDGDKKIEPKIEKKAIISIQHLSKFCGEICVTIPSASIPTLLTLALKAPATSA
jgi:hypothetical protein